jgi:uncharacterized protein with von Willebrand factor type A (vWA) domain
MAGFEWAALLSGDETLHADWLKRALNGGIRHRKFGGKEQQGRGPLVLVRDESGSMEGNPHALAVALEWALLEIARRDKREFYCIPFSGTGQFHVWQAPKVGQPDPQGLLAHLAHFYGGGTEPYAPMLEAREAIEGHQLRADVLVFTDAAFGAPPDEFMRKPAEAKQRQPMRIVSVVIGDDTAQAETFADRVIRVNDLLADREQLRSAVAEIIR